MRQRLPFLHFYLDFLDFEAAEPSLASGGLAVVMEEVPTAVVLADAVVGSPPDDGLKELTTETEGTIGAVAYAIAEEVGVACAPGKDSQKFQSFKVSHPLFFFVGVFDVFDVFDVFNL